MNREDVAKVIEALVPYVRIDDKAVLTSVIVNPIELPSEMDTLYEKVLFALAWRDIEGNKGGILDTWQERRVTSISHKLSNSGNPTWYCQCEDGNIIYLSQSNKEIMTTPYPAIDDMAIGDVVLDVDITIYTTSDAKFMNIMKVVPGGFFKFKKESESERRYEVVKQLDAIRHKALYLDVETTGLDESAEIVSIVVASVYSEFETFIKPVDISKMFVVGKGNKSAANINGITEEDLIDAPTFPEAYEEIKKWIEGKTVITYGDFDRKMLNQVCAQHGLSMIVFKHVDLMSLYSEYDGTIAKRGGYKFHKLADAYQTMTKRSLDGAHNAMADVQAMIEIVSAITDQLPF